jgi:hypothetical protein
MKTNYKVLMRFKSPAWDEVEGIEYQVTADNKADAVKRARRQADNDGHMGVRYFKATEQE